MLSGMLQSFYVSGLVYRIKIKWQRRCIIMTWLYSMDVAVIYCINRIEWIDRIHADLLFLLLLKYTHTEDTVHVTIYNCQLVLLLLILLFNVNGFPTDAFIFIISTFPVWIKLQLPWWSCLHYSCSIGISSISRRAHRYSPNNTIAIIEQIWTIHQSQVAGKPS